MRFSSKDRLIAALVAQLRAERETRETLVEVIAGGQDDADVLLAILTDPVPVFTLDDLRHADRLAAPQQPAQRREAA